MMAAETRELERYASYLAERIADEEVASIQRLNRIRPLVSPEEYIDLSIAERRQVRERCALLQYELDGVVELYAALAPPPVFIYSASGEIELAGFRVEGPTPGPSWRHG